MAPLRRVPLARIALAVVSIYGAHSAVTPIQGQSVERRSTFVQTIPGTEVSFEMALLLGGSFQLGSPMDEAGRDDDEGPPRTVAVDAFWMGVTEVTHEVFAVFRDRRLDTEVGATPEITFDADAVTRPSPPYEDPSHGMSGPGRPAAGMTRLSALRFAQWLSEKTGRLYRLPTEAEWEFACLAGNEGPFGAGADVAPPNPQEPDAAFLDSHAWYADNSGGSFHEVGAKYPNAWGIHDLLGNVAEWTLDPYDAHFYASIADDGSAANPTTGPSARGRGVVRGGAFDDAIPQLRCADRFEEIPQWQRRDPQMPKSVWWNTDAPHVGFRFVSPAVDLTPEEIRAYWEAMLDTADE